LVLAGVYAEPRTGCKATAPGQKLRAFVELVSSNFKELAVKVPFGVNRLLKTAKMQEIFPY
jgi:hypothetical protein